MFTVLNLLGANYLELLPNKDFFKPTLIINMAPQIYRLTTLKNLYNLLKLKVENISPDKEGLY